MKICVAELFLLLMLCYPLQIRDLNQGSPLATVAQESERWTPFYPLLLFSPIRGTEGQCCSLSSIPDPHGRSEYIKFPGERCCWRLSISSHLLQLLCTSAVPCAGSILYPSASPDCFGPTQLWFWQMNPSHRTNTSSFHMDIQEPMLLHLLHQPKNSSSGSQHSPSTAQLMEFMEFSPLSSQCSFLFFLRQEQLGWDLLCPVLGL